MVHIKRSGCFDIPTQPLFSIYTPAIPVQGFFLPLFR